MLRPFTFSANFFDGRLALVVQLLFECDSYFYTHILIIMVIQPFANFPHFDNSLYLYCVSLNLVNFPFPFETDGGIFLLLY